MTNMEPKKISFGFSKISKPNILSKKPTPVEENKVQLIEYLEGQSIKVVGGQDDKPKELLVIPMKAPNKKLINLVDIVQNNFVDKVEEPVLEEAPNNNTENGNKEVDAKPLSLDEQAAKELLNDLKKTEPKEESQRIIEVEKEKDNLEGEKESTIEDYESIPVEDFGKAMLRGMGWKDGTGIGKNQQLVKMAQPPLRPKGMGLGADKLTKQDTNVKPAVDRDGKVLSCVKGALVKVIAGYHKGSYGQIIGFDDESGRFIIKTALNNLNISLNEFLVTPVTKEDYNKNSKVINNAKYEEYIKKKEAEKELALKMETEQSVKVEKGHDSSSEEGVRQNRKEDKRDLKVQEKSRIKKEYQEEKRVTKRNMSSEEEDERRKDKRDDKSRLKAEEKRRNKREYEEERRPSKRDLSSDEEGERRRNKNENKSRSKFDNKTEEKRRKEERRPNKRELSSEDDRQSRKKEKSRKYSVSESESSDQRYKRKVKREELSDEEHSRSRKKDKSSSKRSTKQDSENEENRRRDKNREKKKHPTSSESEDSEEERHRKKKSKKKHKKNKKRSSEDSADDRHRRKKKESKYSSDSEQEKKKSKRKKDERDRR